MSIKYEILINIYDKMVLKIEKSFYVIICRIYLLLPQRIILNFERVKSGEMLIKKSVGL
jgi:hypothetical protein